MQPHECERLPESSRPSRANPDYWSSKRLEERLELFGGFASLRPPELLVRTRRECQSGEDIPQRPVPTAEPEPRLSPFGYWLAASRVHWREAVVLRRQATVRSCCLRNRIQNIHTQRLFD